MDGTGRRVARVAARQHGVVSRRQLRALGVSDDQVDRWAARGRLHRLFHAVYAVGHPQVGVLGRSLAAVLSTGGVLSHRSAAALWDIRSYDGPPELTLRRSGARRRRDARVHVTRSLRPAEVTRLHGIPVTTATRTVIDLRDVLTAPAHRRAVGRAVRAGLVDPLDLTAPRGRRAIAGGAPVFTRSEFEARFERAVVAWGLPAPTMNAWVLGMEVDAHWPEQRLVVELDHPHTHFNLEAFEWDRVKQERLEDAGLRVRRVTERRLRERPSEVRAALERALHRR